MDDLTARLRQPNFGQAAIERLSTQFGIPSALAGVFLATASGNERAAATATRRMQCDGDAVQAFAALVALCGVPYEVQGRWAGPAGRDRTIACVTGTPRPGISTPRRRIIAATPRDYAVTIRQRRAERR